MTCCMNSHSIERPKNLRGKTMRKAAVAKIQTPIPGINYFAVESSQSLNSMKLLDLLRKDDSN